MNRERQKRSTLNDKFSELRNMLCLGDNSRVEKLKILVEAIAELENLTLQNTILLRETNSLREALQLYPPNGDITPAAFVKPEPMSPMLEPGLPQCLPPISEVITAHQAPVVSQNTLPPVPFHFQQGVPPQQTPLERAIKFEQFNSDFCMDLDDMCSVNTTDKAEPSLVFPKWGEDKLSLSQDDDDELIDSFFSNNESFNPRLLTLRV